MCDTYTNTNKSIHRKGAITMAKSKKSVVPAAATATAARPSSNRKVTAKTRAADVSAVREITGEELVIENFAAMTRLVETLGETLELLTQKAESMAYHIIATEQLLAELIADNGINLAGVNGRIRQKIASGTDGTCDPSKAIDIAASIASPLPRR